MMEEAAGGAEVSLLVRYRTYLSELRRSEEELVAAVSQQKVVVTSCASELESALEREQVLVAMIKAGGNFSQVKMEELFRHPAVVIEPMLGARRIGRICY